SIPLLTKYTVFPYTTLFRSIKIIIQMRKITLLLGCFIGLSGAVSAQDLQQSPDINGLLDRLSQIGNNMGDISDYFTQEEQRTLQDRKSTRLNSSHVKISYAV